MCVFYEESLYCTVGCHPTRTLEFETEGENPDNYLRKLVELASANRDKVVAAGEMGLGQAHYFVSFPSHVQQKHATKEVPIIVLSGASHFEDFRNSVSSLRT